MTEYLASARHSVTIRGLSRELANGTYRGGTTDYWRMTVRDVLIQYEMDGRDGWKLDKIHVFGRPKTQNAPERVQFWGDDEDPMPIPKFLADMVDKYRPAVRS